MVRSLAVCQMFLAVIIVIDATIPPKTAILYVTNGGEESCQGPSPIVQISSRSGDVAATDGTPPQPFTDWSLDGYFTGNCTQPTTLSIVTESKLYQFRVELTPGSPCHCVMIEVAILTSIINTNKFTCGVHQPNNSMLCPEINQTRTFVSEVLNVTFDEEEEHPTVKKEEICNCSVVPFSTHKTTDLAVAYQNTFQSCPVNSCFPLLPVPRSIKEETRDISLKFSLILKYKVQPTTCADLNAANEGVLVKADSTNSTDYLNFYYEQTRHESSGNRTPLIHFLDGEKVNLTYYGRSYILPGTLDQSVGLRNFSLNITQLEDQVVTITWEQHAHTPFAPDCDLWSLDNVVVTTRTKDCDKTIFNDDFESQQSHGWTLLSSEIANGNIKCAVDLSHCLFFTGRNDIFDNTRFAKTPMLDLRRLPALQPLPAPNSVSMHTFPCLGSLKPLVVKFRLLMHRFQYPSACTDFKPNGISLTIPDNVSVAYYVPVLDANWLWFNVSNMSFQTISGDIPVYIPYPNQLIEITTCVDTTDREYLHVIWRQDNFQTGFDHWYLAIEHVSLDHFRTNNITDDSNDKSYTLTHVNHVDSDTPVCDLMANANNVISLTGNDSSTRLVNLTLNLTHIFALPCTADGIWNETTNCTISTAVAPDCLKSTDGLAKRICNCDATKGWGPVFCSPNSYEFAYALVEISPEQSIQHLTAVPHDAVTNSQRLDLLQRAVNIEIKRTGKLTQSFLQTCVDLIEMAFMDESESMNFTDLLEILDKISLMFTQNATINSRSNSIVLKVKEVLPNSDRTLGIEVNSNYISLPGELFKDLNESVFVSSLFFKNVPSLLPRSPISPVMSTILSCNNCRTNNLSENVTIFFSSRSLEETPINESLCVFIDLQGGADPDVWNTNGCTTFEYDNESVMCSCNHLTHFAILLGPGVEIPQLHVKVLTLIGQVFVAISLVFLLATILTYVLHKSLWNMRNYIHVMLCANLFAAQLVFVVGVERTENEVVCSAIAVLLHYMFLVVFMWMLMEGVVLYVALVKVFIKHHVHYIAGFTVASYGIPLVYLGIVTPLGFLVNTNANSTHSHYGVYNTSDPDQLQLVACWLRYDTRFIWAMIVPVLCIIAVNIGFMAMALVVMQRHFKKQKKSKYAAASHWFKVIISLMVVMGVTWIGNVLFFDINLLFVAYIMTILIAGQGVIIFILFVPLSKQVREAYGKFLIAKMPQSTIINSLFKTKTTSLSDTEKSTKQRSKSSDHHMYGNIVLGTFDSYKNDDVENLQDESCDGNAQSPEKAKMNDTTIISNEHIEDFTSGTCSSDNEYNMEEITCTEKKCMVSSAEDDAQSRGYQDSQTAYIDFID